MPREAFRALRFCCEKHSVRCRGTKSIPCDAESLGNAARGTPCDASATHAMPHVTSARGPRPFIRRHAARGTPCDHAVAQEAQRALRSCHESIPCDEAVPREALRALPWHEKHSVRCAPREALRAMRNRAARDTSCDVSTTHAMPHVTSARGRPSLRRPAFRLRRGAHHPRLAKNADTSRCDRKQRGCHRRGSKQCRAGQRSGYQHSGDCVRRYGHRAVIALLSLTTWSSAFKRGNRRFPSDTCGKLPALSRENESGEMVCSLQAHVADEGCERGQPSFWGIHFPARVGPHGAGADCLGIQRGVSRIAG